MEEIIIVGVELDCDINTAFSMFTQSIQLEKWLTLKANVEPHFRGKYELFWNPEDPESDSTIGCKITGYEKDKFISFNWKGPVEFASLMNSTDPLTHVVVFFSNNIPPVNKLGVGIPLALNADPSVPPLIGWRITSKPASSIAFFVKSITFCSFSI